MSGILEIFEEVLAPAIPSRYNADTLKYRPLDRFTEMIYFNPKDIFQSQIDPTYPKRAPISKY